MTSTNDPTIPSQSPEPSVAPRTRPSVPRQGDFAPAFTGNPLAEGSVPAPTSSGDFKPAFTGNPLAGAAAEPSQASKRDEIMEAAVQDARVIEEQRKLPQSGKLTDQQREEVIAKVREYAKSRGISAHKIARQTGFGASTISQVLTGHYTGDRDKVIRSLSSWLEQDARGSRPGLPSGAITTEVCEKMIAVFLETQRTRKMSLITGPCGMSKSMMCATVARGGVHGITLAHHIELDVGHGTQLAFARRVATAIGIPTGGSLGVLMDRVIKELTGTDRMLIVDECHFMDAKARQVALGIHKRAGVPIVFVGTEVFDDNADDTGSFDGQFTSHLVWRYRITEAQERKGGKPLFSPQEIEHLAGAMSLKISRDAAIYLAELASVPGLGGLRLTSMLLLKANLPAKRTDSGVIQQSHVEAAWERSHGHNRVKLANARRIVHRQAKTA